LELDKNAEKEPILNVSEIVMALRDQRTKMVQTTEQYEYCYIAIAEGVKQILKEKGINYAGKSNNDDSNSSEGDESKKILHNQKNQPESEEKKSKNKKQQDENNKGKSASDSETPSSEDS